MTSPKKFQPTDGEDGGRWRHSGKDLSLSPNLADEINHLVKQPMGLGVAPVEPNGVVYPTVNIVSPVFYVVVLVTIPAPNLYSRPVRTVRITPLVYSPFARS